jgi:hypothetical protein
MKFNTSKKIFIHVDCDSFFAECEIFRNPSLKDKYVLVWNEIILACNYKTKALWIKTWTPIWQAKDILKGKWVFLDSDHNFYSLVSSKLMNYLEQNTLYIEPFSIDEAFCEITWLPELSKMSLEEYVLDLQKRVIKNVWVPVSIWVSTTRIKAKIFSKLNKPKWIFIDLWNSKELFKTLELSIVPFIWKSMQNALKYKCNNVYDFISLWYQYLNKSIWKTATDLWLELSWVNSFKLRKIHISKSMSRWRSFNKNITNNKEFLYSQLLLNFNHLYEEFTIKNYTLKKVSIFFRDKQKQTHVFNYILEENIFIRKNILNIVKKLFLDNYDVNMLYRSSWVIFSNLDIIKNEQLSLFEDIRRDNSFNHNLLNVINKINNNYDSHKISFWTDLLWKSFDAKLWIIK